MDDEKEKLKRIREAQIRARDPGSSKIRNYDWAKHAELAGRKQRVTLKSLFLDLPTRWKGTLIGLCFGAGIAMFMSALLLTDSTRVLAIIPIFILAIVGFFGGKAMEDPIET